MCVDDGADDGEGDDDAGDAADAADADDDTVFDIACI